MIYKYSSIIRSHNKQICPFTGDVTCFSFLDCDVSYDCTKDLDSELLKYIGFDVFTVVVMKSIIFWEMMPCSPLSCNRRFGGTYRLHFQGRRIVQQTIE
jgi:hypothetical protein